jgi:benzoyl-CoA reductase subunit C
MAAGDANTILDTFREVLGDPDGVARDWKEQGKRVVGYRCIYVPEDIIWAADMLPYPLYGTPEPIGLADAYFQSCSCEFVRNIFDHALAGRYSFLDHLVLANTCEFSRGLFALWDTYIQGIPVYMVNNPLKLMDDSNREYYRAELERFKAAMERLSGTAVSNDRLRNSIALHNETRSLLKELYSLRKEDPPAITGEEALEIALATSLLPKDRANPLLRQLLEGVKAREVPNSSGPRLLVTGSIMDNAVLIRMVEEEGGQVVADDLCTTTKYFWNQVPSHEDPIEALYRFENRRPLCTCTHPMEARLEHLQELIDEFAVEGIIYFNLKYCHPLAYEAPIVKEEFEGKGIQSIILEVGHDMSGHGQLRTRIQAFIEMLEL